VGFTGISWAFMTPKEAKKARQTIVQMILFIGKMWLIKGLLE